MTYCFLLQPAVVHNFSQIDSTFSVPFRDYVANCWWFHGMVSICLIGKDEYSWFLHEYKGHLLDWLIFLALSTTISLLSKIFCQDNKLFYFKSISAFPASVCPNAIYVSLPFKVFHEVNLEENFINFVAFCLHGLVCWRLIVSK